MAPRLGAPRSPLATDALGAEDATIAAQQFVELLAALDRGARRQRRTIPTMRERRALLTEFWVGLVETLERVECCLHESELQRARCDVRAILNPWLLRSRHWDRSYVKPHGYAGDFRMLEWMYDLEIEDCADPTLPLVVNLLDELFRSVHSVRAVWHRRAWFAAAITAQLNATDGPIQLLDVACGGSRYLRDVIDRHGGETLRVTFVDQDPTALSFVESWLPPAALAGSRRICAPVRRLSEAMPGGPFDLVIATRLFDYLENQPARELLGDMAALTRPGGAVAICNFAPDDRSRVVRSWIADWQLIYRTAEHLRTLFPTELVPSLSRSPDGSLIYAHAVTGPDLQTRSIRRRAD